MADSRYPWRVFWVLMGGALAGVFALLPYVLVLFENVLKNRDVQASPTAFVVMQVLHLTLLFGLAAGFGLMLAPRVGLKFPLLRGWLEGDVEPVPRGAWRAAVVAGVAIGAYTVLALYGFIVPRVPQWPSEAAMPLWTRALMCFYGAINEELLMRLFVLSLLLWLVQKIARRDGPPAGASFWIANVLAALVYGAAYLPAAAGVAQLTAFAMVAIVAVKGVAGLAFGQLFRSYGLEVVMVAHFISDLLIHVVGPVFAPM